MGFFDYVSDLYSSLSVQSAEAEEQQQQFPGGIVDKSGEQSSGTDHTSGGIGHPEQDRGAAVKGGASTSTPALGGQDESDEEAEVNAQDKKTGSGSGEKGHTPGEGGEGSGQLGKDYVPQKAGEDDEEEEEEEDEPEDIKPKLEEGKWRESQQRIMICTSAFAVGDLVN